MTKSELIEKIAAKNPSLTVKEIDRIVTVILDSIINALADGERVEFRGFGAFSIRTRTLPSAKSMPKRLILTACPVLKTSLRPKAIFAVCPICWAAWTAFLSPDCKNRRHINVEEIG